MNNDTITRTSHKNISINKPKTFKLSKLVYKIDELVFAAKTENGEKLVSTLKKIVPRYTSADIQNKENNSKNEVALDFQ